MPDETLMQQLRRILDAMRTSGRKPMRIYLTYTQLQALNAEMRAVSKYRFDEVRGSRLEFYGIPVELTPPGSGMWISCTSEVS